MEFQRNLFSANNYRAKRQLEVVEKWLCLKPRKVRTFYSVNPSNINEASIFCFIGMTCIV